MFATRMTPAIARWGDLIESAATAQRLDPYLVAAIMHVESGGGTLLRPADPTGTGDWAPRDPAKWGSAMPPDGLGWGRGLMQIDWFSNRDWCAQKDASGIFIWQIPSENIAKGCQKIRAAADQFGDADLEAIAASYNIGITGVARVLLRLPMNPNPADRRLALDTRSAPPHHYVTAVLNRRASFLPQQ